VQVEVEISLREYEDALKLDLREGARSERSEIEVRVMIRLEVNQTESNRMKLN